MNHFQIVVVGSGFPGSLTAMIARRLGFTTALIERGKHPRFAIGESSTPLANLLLQQIAETYDLPFLRPLCKWGTWQQHLPQIGCGLKRGFTFYHHELGKPFADPDLKRQLLVGASATETVADTHWYRPDFDQYLVTQAQELGVTYLDETDLLNLSEQTNTIELRGTRRCEPVEIRADFVIDATGPRGFLHRALNLPQKQLPLLPPTQALFTHFTGVGSLSDSFHLPNKTPPYPPEQAAVHHIFPGGWVWVLKFNNGITSAGLAATDSFANTLTPRSAEHCSARPNPSATTTAWKNLLKKLPSLHKMFAPASATIPFIHQSRLAFQCATVHGRRWLMLPSAAGFVDPLLSTGFPLALFGITRVGALLSVHWEKPSFARELENYAQATTCELEMTATLIAALYSSMNRFELFKQLSLLYFAAAHYSESMRRQGQAHLVKSFLLSDHPIFSNQLRRICEETVQGSVPEETLVEKIRSAIKPYDLVGFTDPSKDPWYQAT